AHPGPTAVELAAAQTGVAAAPGKCLPAGEPAARSGTPGPVVEGASAGSESARLVLRQTARTRNQARGRGHPAGRADGAVPPGPGGAWPPEPALSLPLRDGPRDVQPRPGSRGGLEGQRGRGAGL